MKNIIFLSLFVINLNAFSQSKVHGEYVFSRQEMVAGFDFSDGNKFKFFYAYGAVDRSATGTFYIINDTLKLKSDKKPGRDFTVTGQSKNDSGYTLLFDFTDKNLLRDIRCLFFIGGEMQEVYTDDNGEVHTNIPHCDTIYVQHMQYPDIVTIVKDINNDNNYFKLTLNPSLEQVSFKGIDFKIVSDKLITCLPNYFMEMPDIEFKKQ